VITEASPNPWHALRVPKRLSKDWRPTDVNQLAHHLVRLSTQSDPDVQESIALKPERPTKSEISRVMAAMGSRGGKIGGKRRLVTMTAEQRKQIAVKAAKKRWENAKAS
jgi:hypothetical protein